LRINDPTQGHFLLSALQDLLVFLLLLNQLEQNLILLRVCFFLQLLAQAHPLNPLLKLRALLRSVVLCLLLEDLV